MHITTEKITPDKARQYLALNTSNRPISSKHVQYLAQQMRDGQYQTTGQTLQFSLTKKLLDGQHRLLAIIASATTQTMIVVRNLPDKVFTVLDRGKPRSIADVISIAGYTRWVTRASLAKSILYYDGGKINSAFLGNDPVRGKESTPDGVLEFLKTNNLDDEVAFGDHAFRTNKARFLSIKQWGLIYYILKKVDAKEAYTFLDKLSSGENLPKGHMLDARNKLLASQMDPLRKMTPKSKYIMIAKSWNHYRKGKTVGLTTVRADDEFPTLL